MVLVHSDGERSFLHHIGANGTFGLEDVDIDRIAACDHLHVAGALVMPRIDGPASAEILTEAKSAGLSTSLDTAWDATGRWLKTLEPCLPHIDFFMPSLEEARELSGLAEPGAILEFFLERGCANVILKMGERGSMAGSGSQIIVAPAIPTPSVDATGAGDCFAAGFIRGLVDGWDLPSCLRLGNALGAACVRSVGATAGVGDFDESLRLMNSAPPARVSSRISKE
jgi:sugar/nucleoside kinase (ribokinase family)